MSWPPRTKAELEAYLRYQKAELLALPMVARRVCINGKVLRIPDSVREDIAMADNIFTATGPRLDQYLLQEHGEDYWASKGVFAVLQD